MAFNQSLISSAQFHHFVTVEDGYFQYLAGFITKAFSTIILR